MGISKHPEMMILMRVDYREGDSYTDRLFQWLKHDENIPIELDQVIKPRVYKVYVNGDPRILKGYRKPQTLQQQIDFFNLWEGAENIAARPLPFHHQDFTKSKLGCDWGLFEWVRGKHADFEKQSDREAALRVLQKFHKLTKSVTMVSVPKDPLYVKWEKRLEQFSVTRDVFFDYGRRKTYEEIYECMAKQLEAFSGHPWGEIEEKAWDNHEWLHGDVAHHNFLIDRKKKIKLIDFDLLHTGPHLYDYIQLGQRFLPHTEENPEILFELFKHVKDQKIWLQGLHVPADILREWLYGYRRGIRGEATFSRQLRKVEKAWSSRKKFVRSTENMVI